jgi:hypothetical protein
MPSRKVLERNFKMPAIHSFKAEQITANNVKISANPIAISNILEPNNITASSFHPLYCGLSAKEFHGHATKTPVRIHPQISAPLLKAREANWTRNQFADEYLEITPNSLGHTYAVGKLSAATTDFALVS